MSARFTLRNFLREELPGYGEEVLSLLEATREVRYIAALDGTRTVLIEWLRHPAGQLAELPATWWTLHDNGGEIQIAKVNDPESSRAIGFHDGSGLPTAPTLAERIWFSLASKPVDYDRVATDWRRTWQEAKAEEKAAA